MSARAPAAGGGDGRAPAPSASAPGAAPSERGRRSSGAYHYARTPTSQGGPNSPNVAVRTPPAARASEVGPSPSSNPTQDDAAGPARAPVTRAPAPRSPASTTGPGPARPVRRAPPGRRSGPNAASVTQGSLTGTREAVRGPKKPEISPREHFKNGLTFLSAGQSDRALESFKEATEAEPANVSYMAHHAWAQYLVDPETAKDVVTVLKRAIAESDESSVEWPALFMGHILSAEGQEDQAVGYYRECLHGNPRNVEAKRRLRLYDMRTKTGGSFLDKLFSSSKAKTKDVKKNSKR
jgi:hypothetical protein